MPVNVCGHLNIRVSHVFLNVFQRKSVIQKQARAAMPEFMETNMRQMVVFQKKRKMGGYIVRRKRLAVGPLEDKIILLIFIASELAIYPLIGFCLEKNFSGFLCQRERTVAGAVFRLVFAYGSCDL